MVCDDFRHKQRYFVWRVELAGFFTGICRKHTDKIFIDKAKNIVILLAVHRNIFNQMNKVTDSLGLRSRAVAQFRQSCLKGIKYSLKYFFVGCVNQTAKSRKSVTNILNAKISAFAEPSGKQVIIRDKITQVLLNTLDCFRIFLGQIRKILVSPIIFFKILYFLLR